MTFQSEKVFKCREVPYTRSQGCGAMVNAAGCWIVIIEAGGLDIISVQKEQSVWSRENRGEVKGIHPRSIVCVLVHCAFWATAGS